MFSPGDLEITDDLVAALIGEQFPELADRPVEIIGRGWDNVIARVGPGLAARLPMHDAAVPLIENEQRWLPELAPLVPVSVPAPYFVGEPGQRYPWPWSIVPYFEGRTALDRRLNVLAQHRLAEQVAEFLVALGVPSPPDAPYNPVRGVPLATRDERSRGALARLAAGGWPLSVAAEQRWAAVVGAAVPDVACWVHGDTHPANLILDDRGDLVAVIDWGDVCGGDPATDLVIAWMLFDPGPRARFRAAVGADEDTWARGQGWALTIGLALMDSERSDDRFRALGDRTVAAVLAEEPPA